MEIENFRYEIDENNAIRCWNLDIPDEQGRPFLYQPVNPNGNAWADHAEAEAWVNEFIQELLKPAPVIEEEAEEAEAEEVIEAEVVNQSEGEVNE